MILNNLQNTNAQLIEEKISQSERLVRLNHSARRQMKVLKDNKNIKDLELLQKQVNEENKIKCIWWGKRTNWFKERKKGEHESYTTNNILNEYKNIKYESIRIDFKNKVITLPRLKKIEFRGYRKIKK